MPSNRLEPRRHHRKHAAYAFMLIASLVVGLGALAALATGITPNNGYAVMAFLGGPFTFGLLAGIGPGDISERE